MGVNVVRCQNGHFYDSGKYAACPHCGVQVETAAAKQPEKKVHSLFGKKTKKEETESTPTSAVKEGAATKDEPVVKVTTPSPAPEVKDDDLTTAILKKRAEEERDVNDDTPTVQYWEDKTVAMIGAHTSAKAEPEGVDAERVEPMRTEPVKVELPKAVPTPEIQPENRAAVSSLQAKIQQASAGSEGKTIGVFSMGHSSAPSMPVTPASVPTGGAPAPGGAPVAHQAPVYDGPVDPVVGWLVCIRGKHFGESFNIAAGKNSIGRSANNHIVLWKDNSVSREKHAMVIYEPKKRNFYVQPGDSSGLTYLNDEYITESKRLASGDIVELGDCQFIFIPLCGEKFTWEDYISKE